MKSLNKKDLLRALFVVFIFTCAIYLAAWHRSHSRATSLKRRIGNHLIGENVSRINHLHAFISDLAYSSSDAIFDLFSTNGFVFPIEAIRKDLELIYKNVDSAGNSIPIPEFFNTDGKSFYVKVDGQLIRTNMLNQQQKGITISILSIQGGDKFIPGRSNYLSATLPLTIWKGIQ